MRVFFIRFQTAYHGRAQTALPFAMNSEFSRVLSTEMVSKAGHPQSMFIGNVNNNYYMKEMLYALVVKLRKCQAGIPPCL